MAEHFESYCKVHKCGKILEDYDDHYIWICPHCEEEQIMGHLAEHNPYLGDKLYGKESMEFSGKPKVYNEGFCRNCECKLVIGSSNLKISVCGSCKAKGFNL